MRLSDIIISANQSLFRNKVRTFLTVIAIFIGATTLSLTNGIGSGIKAYLNKQLGDLGNANSLTITAVDKTTNITQSNALTVYNPNQKKIDSGEGRGPDSATIALTQADIAKIAKIPNITSVQPRLSVTPDYIATATAPSAKYQFSLVQTIGKSSVVISNGVAVNNEGSGNEISIPDSYVSSLGFSSDAAAVGQQVIIGITDATGKQSMVTATITGVQLKTLIGSVAAYANTALYNQLYNLQIVGLPINTTDAYASVAAIYPANLSNAQISTIKNTLTNEGYSGQTIKDQVSTVFTVISAGTDVLDGFAAITLVAATFGIVNTLYMSVAERTKEIGLMKALGLGRRKIFALFSIEAILIGFWGSILGVGFANGIGNIVDKAASKGFLKDFPGLSLLSFPAKPSTIIVLGIMFIAFLAGTLPARRASRKDPIDALRYE